MKKYFLFFSVLFLFFNSCVNITKALNTYSEPSIIITANDKIKFKSFNILHFNITFDNNFTYNDCTISLEDNVYGNVYGIELINYYFIDNFKNEGQILINYNDSAIFYENINLKFKFTFYNSNNINEFSKNITFDVSKENILFFDFRVIEQSQQFITDDIFSDDNIAIKSNPSSYLLNDDISSFNNKFINNIFSDGSKNNNKKLHKLKIKIIPYTYVNGVKTYLSSVIEDQSSIKILNRYNSSSSSINPAQTTLNDFYYGSNLNSNDINISYDEINDVFSIEFYTYTLLLYLYSDATFEYFTLLLSYDLNTELFFKAYYNNNYYNLSLKLYFNFSFYDLSFKLLNLLS